MSPFRGNAFGQGQGVGRRSDACDRGRGERERVLVIRSGALGDTIVALPAIAALGRRAARVEVVGTAPYVELALGPGLAVRTHSVDRAMFGALFQDGAEEAELLDFLGGFDRVVAWSRMPLLAAKLEGLGIELIQSTPLPPDGVHASDHLMQALEPLGINGPAPLPSIQIREGITGFPPKFVAIHPSSGSASKNWAPEHFEGLARLARAAGLDVVWIQGEADESVVSDLARLVPGRLARELPLEELAARYGCLCRLRRERFRGEPSYGGGGRSYGRSVPRHQSYPMGSPRTLCPHRQCGGFPGSGVGFCPRSDECPLVEWRKELTAQEGEIPPAGSREIPTIASKLGIRFSMLSL